MAKDYASSWRRNIKRSLSILERNEYVPYMALRVIEDSIDQMESLIEAYKRALESARNFDYREGLRLMCEAHEVAILTVEMVYREVENLNVYSAENARDEFESGRDDVRKLLSAFEQYIRNPSAEYLLRIRLNIAPGTFVRELRRICNEILSFAEEGYRQIHG